MGHDFLLHISIFIYQGVEKEGVPKHSRNSAPSDDVLTHDRNVGKMWVCGRIYMQINANGSFLVVFFSKKRPQTFFW